MTNNVGAVYDRPFLKGSAKISKMGGHRPPLQGIVPGILLAFLLLQITAWAQSPSDIRKTVDRALPIMQRSAQEFVTKRACVSCHHNILPILMLDLARSRGFTIDSKVLEAVQDKTFRELRGPNALDNAIQVTTLNDPTP